MSGALSREVLDTRLEEQRRRLFQVTALCYVSQRMCFHGVSPVDGKLSSIDACHLSESLRLACEMLEEVTGQLDPAQFLDSESDAQGGEL